MLTVEEVFVLLFRQYPYLGIYSRKLILDSACRLLAALHTKGAMLRVFLRKCCMLEYLGELWGRGGDRQ